MILLISDDSMEFNDNNNCTAFVYNKAGESVSSNCAGSITQNWFNNCFNMP